MFKIKIVSAIISLLILAVHTEEPKLESRSTPTVSGAIHIDITSGHALNSLVPIRTLGAGVDALPQGAVAKIYTPSNLTQMLAAGHGALSYRLFTELSVQAWHWNANGTWSDPAGRGYFTGSITQPDGSDINFGYDLPHRGFTTDQGAQDGFSKLTDGDKTTYWKSNPYLSKVFTGESDTLHPQWVIVDLGASKQIDSVHIDWANPYATDYSVQYWSGDSPIDSPADGAWKEFPHGAISGGTGGPVTLKVADTPMSVRYVRVLMTASSGTFDTHGNSDPRNGLGYAIFEIGVGTSNADGTFSDVVKHGAGQNAQSKTYCSSVDPWHDPSAKNTNQEQVGVDKAFASGLTRGLPAQVPVAMLYGTPDDAAAEIAYLKARGYPLLNVELGEEPDGQYMTPEDYGALYLQFVTAIRKVDAAIPLGGPAFQSGDVIQTWPDANGETRWFKRFVNYLTAHGRLSDLNFFSFEHYPFDPKETLGKKGFTALLQAPARIANVVKNFRAEGLPPNIPFYVTEYNFSADNTPAVQELVGGLWHADFIGSLLNLGAAGAFYYEYEPTPLSGSGGKSGGKGTLGMFYADKNYGIVAPTSQFFSTQILMYVWLSPTDAIHEIYPASSNVTDKGGNTLVTAYAAKLPDGTFSLLLINKSPTTDQTVTLDFANTNGGAPAFNGAVQQVTFGAAQFQWHPGSHPNAKPDSPPVATTLATLPASVTLPKSSLVVLRGSVK